MYLHGERDLDYCVHYQRFLFNMHNSLVNLTDAQFVRHMDLDLRGAFKALNPHFVVLHLWVSQQCLQCVPANRRCMLLLSCLSNLRQTLTDINSDTVQTELRNAGSASRTAQVALTKAQFDAMCSGLELDQVTFRATDARAQAAEESRNHRTAGLLEAVHQKAWSAAEDFANNRFPVFCGKADTLAADLPSQMSAWVTKRTIGNHGVAKIVWVNFTVLGVVSGGKLNWVADYVSAELHSTPTTSVAIIVQGNRSYDELRSKVDDVGVVAGKADAKSESDTDSGADDKCQDGKPGWDGISQGQGQGSARMGHAKSLRQHRQRIEDVFCEEGRGLLVHNATLVFDPPTVWGSRHGSHSLLVVIPRSVPPSRPQFLVRSTSLPAGSRTQHKSHRR